MHAHVNAPRPEEGFSLLELVVAVSLLTVILGAAFHLMAESQVNFDRNQVLAEAHQNADFAVLRVAELVRGAGANPEGSATINSLAFISNREAGATADDPNVVRIVSDLNGDRDVQDRVNAVIDPSGKYFILASEDITIKYYPNETTVGSVTVPGHTLCMIDNTPNDGSNIIQGVPIVLAEHVSAFSCPVLGTDPTEVTLTVEGGPSRDVPPSDPRYATFTRVMQVRLRNRV